MMLRLGQCLCFATGWWGMGMSNALVASLRESRGYLEDAGYHQTAQLMAHAADEIERLARRVEALERGAENSATGRGSIDRLKELRAGVASLAASPSRQRS